MQIGIDITSLLYHRGVSRYTSNLVQALLETEHQLNLFGYSLRQRQKLKQIGNQLLAAEPQNRQSRLVTQPIPPTLMSWLWRFGLNPVHRQLEKIEVFHSWDWLQPPDTSIPLVSTIHDLAILRFPETAHPKVRARHQRSWEVLKQRQAHLIAVSRSTKLDIIELIGYPKYLIHVIPEALPREFRATANALTAEEIEQINTKLKLNRPYILFVGTREPRKNLTRLIQAWEPLADQVDLLIAGETGWDGTEQLDATKLAKRGLRFLGRVNDQELVALYSQAEALAFPSLYEGFGLPILEAFHQGTPVVTSDNSGMREVAGNAAELVDPQQVESIRQGLTTVLNESLPEQRQRLQRMIIRLQMFSWETVAKQTLKVYKQAITEFNQ